MLVKDIMTKNPITVNPEMSVLEVKDVMNTNKINKLPVLDKSGALVGILTKNDLIKASPSDATTLDMFEVGYLLSKLTVEKVMCKNVKFVTENGTVEEAARLMSDFNIGSLPVLNGNIVVGIITESDLFNSFVNMFNSRTPGVRVTVLLDEKPGVLAKISELIAEKNGNIVSLVTFNADDSAHTKVTVKLENISEEDVKEIIASCGYTICDIRSV